LSDNKGRDLNAIHKGPKRMLLLVYLTLNSNKLLRRDKLIAVFWPEKSQKNARNALSNLLYHIRTNTDSEIFITRGTEELKVNHEIILCDALQFMKEYKNKEWTKVENLYTGPFLDGVYISNAPSELEDWISDQREYFKKLYLKVLDHLARQAGKSGKDGEALAWLEKFTEIEPFDTSAVENYIRLLVLNGKKSKAIKAADNHARLLQEEFGENENQIYKRLINAINSIEPKTDTNKQQGSGWDPFVQSVAVLPFEIIGTNPLVSDFAEGLHHDVLTRLAGINGLKVISKTSVLKYRDSLRTIREIADELQVKYIVEGALQESGGKMRLHVQLINTRSDFHQAAETFDCELTGDKIFQIQTDLAVKIQNRLKSEFSPAEIEQVQNQPTKNLEAYLHYTKGRSYLNQRTEKSLNNAVLSFQKSINLDENYAEAWAGLAETLILLEWYNYKTTNPLYDKTYTATKALSLNPDLADAHTSMGILYTSSLNAPDAEREFRTAIRLQPSSAEAFSWLGWLLMITGRPDMAIEPSEKSVAISPYSVYTRTYLSIVYLINHKYNQALDETAKARSIEPEYAIPYYLEGVILFHLKKYSEAEVILNDALNLHEYHGALSGNNIHLILALIRMARGEKHAAGQFLKMKEIQSDDLTRGMFYACISEADKAYKLLERVKVFKAFPTAAIRYFFPEQMKNFREDSRYPRLIERIHRCWKPE